MGLFKQNIPVPVGGVSQLPSETRGPGYADDMVNAFPSSPKGLGVRSGTTALSAGLTSADADSVHTAEVQPSPDEQYVVVFDKNGVRVINALTGALAPLSLAAGASTFLAGGKFSSAAVGDDLYVAARGISKATLGGTPVPAQANGALITVESGQPSALYKITLDGISVSVRTPDDPPPPTKRPAVGITVNTGDGAVLNLSLLPSATVLKPSFSSSHALSFNRSTYTGTVTISATSGTPGISASLAATSFAMGGSDSTTLTISVAGTVAPGLYSIQLIASGVDVPDCTMDVSVSVVDPASDPGGGTATPGYFTVLQPSASMTVDAGSSTPFVWGVSRSSGFTNDITYAQLSTPAGMTITFSPGGLSGSASTVTMTVGVGSGVTPGSYTFPVQFHVVGSADVTRYVTVNVNTGGGPFEFSSANPPDEFTSVSSGSVSMAVTRGSGFTSDITLSVQSFSAGSFTAITFDPSTLSGTTGAFLMNYDLFGIPAGDYTLTIKASSAGQPDVFGTITIHYAP